MSSHFLRKCVPRAGILVLISLLPFELLHFLRLHEFLELAFYSSVHPFSFCLGFYLGNWKYEFQ